MRNLKTVTNEEPQYYRTYHDGDYIEKINYDKKTNIASIGLVSFPLSGTGLYWEVRNFSGYDPFITKPTKGERVNDFTPVQFNTPDGESVSGYLYRYGSAIYSSPSSSSTQIGRVSEISISALPKYGEYQYLIHKTSGKGGFGYYEYANDSNGLFIDGPGLYCYDRYGNIVKDSEYGGKWTIGEQVNAYTMRGTSSTYYPITANIITNSRGKQLYYADVDGDGNLYISRSGSTFNNLPVLSSYYYTLQEKTPFVASYYESDIRPGVTYNREERNVIYNNPNKNLYFNDPDFTGENRDISSVTFNELGITVDTIEKYVELLRDKYYPADWFNIRINGNKFESAGFNSGNGRTLQFKFGSYRVTFDLDNETCVFNYYVPGPK